MEYLQPALNYGSETKLFIASISDILQHTSLENAYDYLDIQERKVCEKVRCSDRYKEYLLGRFLVKSTLAAELNLNHKTIVFEKTALGKPFFKLDSTELFFNLSHSNDQIALCISADSEVGVDIECGTNARTITSEMIAIAKRHFTEKEAEIITLANESERKELFFRMWVCKEAALKAIGVGLTAPMACVDTLRLVTADSLLVTINNTGYDVHVRHFFNLRLGFHLAIAKVGVPFGSSKL